MPITFPRAMPAGIGVSRCRLEPNFVTVAPRTRGAELIEVEIGDAYWSVDLTFARKMPAEVLRLRTWFDSMRAGLGTFLCHDYARPRPLDYLLSGLPATKAGGGAFDGSCDVDAVTAHTITLSGLPDAMQFREGDYVGLVQSSRYGLFQVTVDQAANGSGVVTLDVLPAVNLNVFTADATAQVEKPVAEFKPLTRTADPAPERTAVVIRGVQKL